MLTGTRRRQSALNDLARRGGIIYSQAGILRQTYAFPDRLADASRFLRDIVAVMAGNPNPPTFGEILVRHAAETADRPCPWPAAGVE